MKKKWMLILTLGLVLCLLSGCTALSVTGLSGLAGMRASASIPAASAN